MKSKLSELWRLFTKPYHDLKHCSKVLWLVFAVNLLETFAYFSMSLNFVLFLTQEHKYTNLSAGAIYGLWGMLIGFFGLLSGAIIDQCGIKWSLVIASVTGVAGRLLFAFAPSRFWLGVSVYVLTPFAASSITPICMIVIKYATNTEEQATSAFSLYYSFMNVSSLLSGFLTDAFRQTGSGALQLIFCAGAVTTAAYGILAFCGFDYVDGQLRKERLNNGVDDAAERAKRGILRQRLRDASTAFRDRIFWQLMLFVVLLTCIRLVFRHLDATLPTLLTHGSVYACNPAIIIILTPILQSFFSKTDAYKAIQFGTLLSAVSPLFMAFGVSYFSSVLFVICLSIGEAIWSPRYYSYCVALARPGAEGVYVSLANMPLVAAKLGVGLMSGALLEAYCPPSTVVGSTNKCGMVMLWVAVVSLVSPVFLFLCKPCIHTDTVREKLSRAGGDKQAKYQALQDDVWAVNLSDESGDEESNDVLSFGLDDMIPLEDIVEE